MSTAMTVKALRSRTRQRGQALAEFAIVLPIIVLVMVGLFDAGRLVYINNALAQGAREGARWGTVQGRAEWSGARAAIISETRSRLTAVPNPTVTVECWRDGRLVTWCATGDVLKVTVQASVQPITPIIGDLIGNLNLHSKAEMTVEQ